MFTDNSYCCGETRMAAKKDAENYRQRLLDMLRRIDGDRSDLKNEALQPTGGEASGSLSNVPIHPADLANHVSEEELALGLVENEEQLIEEINAALARMDQGTFGQCEACQSDISRERLQALPYARHCIRCARQLQKQVNA
jgi:DnaK suppressor protein